MSTSKRKSRARPVPLDASQSAVAIFAASLDMTPLYLPTTKGARRVRSTKLIVKREGQS